MKNQEWDKTTENKDGDKLWNLTGHGRHKGNILTVIPQ